MSTGTRIKFVILGWVAASLFFTAILMISDLGGHKSLAYALYTNAIHFAFWALALPRPVEVHSGFPSPPRKKNLECSRAVARGRDNGGTGHA